MEDRPGDVRVEKQRMRSGYVLLTLALAVVGWFLFAVLGDGGGDERSAGSTTSTTGSGATATTGEPPVTTPEGAPVRVQPELHGRVLDPPTGLELLVGGTLVEVDAERMTWVGGLTDRPPGRALGPRSFSVGDASVIVRVFACEGCEHLETRVLVLPEGATSSVPVFSGTDVFVAPSPDGMWVTRFETEDDCTLSEIDLGGEILTEERSLDCGLRIVAETDLGLLAYRDRRPDGTPAGSHVLLDDDLQETFSAHRILAVSGERLLALDGDDTFWLRRADGARASLPTPAAVGEPTFGPVSPDGRHAVVEFLGEQGDLWVLDLRELEWTRVPGFPVRGHGRTIGPQWTDDGRLVVFGPLIDGLGEERDLALATWRPGSPEPAVRRADYPPGPLLVR